MKKSYMDNLPENGIFTERDLWEAIAESLGVEANEIMDGDIADYV